VASCADGRPKGLAARAPYGYERNPGAQFNYPPGTATGISVRASGPPGLGPPHVEHYTPPGQLSDVPARAWHMGAAVQETLTSSPNVAGPSREGFTDPPLPQASARTNAFTAEDLRNLVSNFIRNPESRVFEVQMRPSPYVPGRLLVAVTLEVIGVPSA
jgi:hypothetical protein